MGMIRTELLNSKISTYFFSFVISLQILSVSFSDKRRIAVSDGSDLKKVRIYSLHIKLFKVILANHLRI